MKVGTSLDGPRVRLRPLCADDVDSCFLLLQDEEALRLNGIRAVFTQPS